jgi:hypothetical protein
VIKHPSFTKLLALFSGISVLSFGVGYFTTLQFKPTVFQALKTSQAISFPRKVVQHKVLGLPLNQVRQILRQASFNFLATSAYSLLGSNRNSPSHGLKPEIKNSPSAFNSPHTLNFTRKAEPHQAGQCCGATGDLRGQASEFEFAGSHAGNS